MALLDVASWVLSPVPRNTYARHPCPTLQATQALRAAFLFFKTIGIAAGHPCGGRTEEPRLRGEPQPELALHLRVLPTERQEILQ